MQTPTGEPKLATLFVHAAPQGWERRWELLQEMHFSLLAHLAHAYAKQEHVPIDSQKRILQKIILSTTISRLECEADESPHEDRTPSGGDLQMEALREAGLSLGDFIRIQDDKYVSRFDEECFAMGDELRAVMDLDDAREKTLRSLKAIERAFHGVYSDVEQYFSEIRAELRQRKEDFERKAGEYHAEQNGLRSIERALQRLESSKEGASQEFRAARLFGRN